MASKKGVSPIISAILLLLITVVISTGAYFWMTNMQSNIQEDVQGGLQEEFDEDLKEFNIVNTECNSTSDNVTVLLINPGSVQIDSGDLVVNLKSLQGESLETLIDSSFPGIPVGGTLEWEVSFTYDMQEGTMYAVKLSVPEGKSMSDSCTAQS